VISAAAPRPRQRRRRWPVPATEAQVSHGDLAAARPAPALPRLRPAIGCSQMLRPMANPAKPSTGAATASQRSNRAAGRRGRARSRRRGHARPRGSGSLLPARRRLSPGPRPSRSRLGSGGLVAAITCMTRGRAQVTVIGARISPAAASWPPVAGTSSSSSSDTPRPRTASLTSRAARSCCWRRLRGTAGLSRTSAFANLAGPMSHAPANPAPIPLEPVPGATLHRRCQHHTVGTRRLPTPADRTARRPGPPPGHLAAARARASPA
jgi:hypothetical protein